MNSPELNSQALDQQASQSHLNLPELGQLRETTPDSTQPKVDMQNIHRQRWHDHIRDCKEILRIVEPLEIAGRITKLTGLVMEAAGIKLPIGSACYVPLAEGRRVEAEVVGFDGERMLLMPQSSVDGVP
jgi:hypothetical protein